MANFSFDVVSDYDKAEMINVYEQTKREIDTRYDFKGTVAAIEWLNPEKSGFKILGESEYHIETILDMTRKKLATRGLSQKVLDTSKESIVSGFKTVKEVVFIKGLTTEKAKKVTSLIREKFPKAKAIIQSQDVRVMSSSKDDLQNIMTLLRAANFDFPIDFTNFR